MRLTDRVSAVLDGRLLPESKAPIAVALSGGGDSVALLALALDWAGPRGRPVLALTVDHGLNPDSAAWTRFAAATAGRLGAAHRSLAWTGLKPRAGLPAAARTARHALLADAARAAGAGVILLGHTADDVAEGELMRAEGSTLGALRDWGPSPAWPEGRGVFLLRPLLGHSRAELRDCLRARGLDWIEDPANADPRFARARARASLQISPLWGEEPRSGDGGLQLDATAAAAHRTDRATEAARSAGAPHRRPVGRLLPPRGGDLGVLALATVADDAGGLTIPREALQNVEPSEARAFLSVALLCASGGTRPPRGERLERLLARVTGADAFAATLAGARIEADAQEVRIHRDAGETARGGLGPIALVPGTASVWDGRFEIQADHACEIRPLKGLAARLDRADRDAISVLPSAARPGLPVLVRDGAARPVLAARAACVRVLARPRLLAACGVIAHERENGVSAHGVFNFASLCSGSETPPVAGDQRSRS